MALVSLVSLRLSIIQRPCGALGRNFVFSSFSVPVLLPYLLQGFVYLQSLYFSVLLASCCLLPFGVRLQSGQVETI